MSIKYTISATVPSQCDAQLDFMTQAELEIRSPEAISLAVSLVDEEVNKELLPAVKKLQSLLDSGQVYETVEYEAAVTEVADGIVDSVYVLFQLANSLQLPFDDLFMAVHANNMSKIQLDAEGKLKKREDGKLLKPEGYKKVDLRSILFPAAVGKEAAGVTHLR